MSRLQKKLQCKSRTDDGGGTSDCAAAQYTHVVSAQAQNGTAIPVSMPTPTSQLSSGGRPSRPAPGTDPTSRPAAANRTAAPRECTPPAGMLVRLSETWSSLSSDFVDDVSR